MAETVIVGDDDAEGAGTAEESAHQAAVAEGATAVQAELAAEAAEEAKAAAEVALGAAQANIDSGMAVEGATASAEAAAAQATVSAEMVHDALAAQTAAINTLAEELKASRKASAPPGDGKSGTTPSDRAPAPREHPYYRRIGRGKRS